MAPFSIGKFPLFWISRKLDTIVKLDGLHPSRSSKPANLTVRQPTEDGDDDANNAVDWNRVLDDMKSAFSLNSTMPGGFGGFQNFGCFTCVTRDNDARLMYKGSWALNGSPFDTTHSTTERGASVTFRFNGSGIVVFGTVPQSNDTVRPPTATYILDANQPVVTTSPTASFAIPSQPLFFASQLSTTVEHELTIQVGGGGGFPTAPYILQTFFVFPRFNLTQHLVNTLPSTTYYLPPHTHTTSAPSSGTTPIPTSSSSSATASASMTIRVLAGTLGSLIVLVILIILFFTLHRRQRATKPSSKSKPSKPYMSETSSTASSSRGLREGTILTSTESILQNDPSPSGAFSLYTRSEQGRGSVVDYYLSLPSPLPELPLQQQPASSLPPTPPGPPPRPPPKS